MYYAEKRIKLSEKQTNNFSEDISATATSIDHGIGSDYSTSVDLTNNTSEFSLPPVKRKKSFDANNHASLNKVKNFSELKDLQQTSLGYSSWLHSSTSSSPRKSGSRTPKKRKLEESDENAFDSSYQFASPLKKIAKKESSKLILKEKSSSENVILSSTPIRANNKTERWSKFRSFHPEKFKVERGLTLTNIPNLPNSIEESFDCANSLDFTNSFNLTSTDTHDNVPSNIEQLWKNPLNKDATEKDFVHSELVSGHFESLEEECDDSKLNFESVTTPEKSNNEEKSFRKTSPPTKRTKYFCGRSAFNILGMLHDEKNLALPKILNCLNDTDLLSLSHVSQNFRMMITTNKVLEERRQNYLKLYQKDRENKYPTVDVKTTKPRTTKDKKKVLAECNVNHSMQLRSKVVSPPVSPSRRRFYENQKIALRSSGPLKKCPICSKPAIIMKVRSSPRKKKKTNLFKIAYTNSGRTRKKSASFLSKASIDSQSTNEQFYVTFHQFDDRSATTSSSDTPGPSSSDDSSGSEITASEELHEYAECSGVSCHFKFCVRCNCKYHRGHPCKDLSPPSPPRGLLAKTTVVGSRKSLKSLKRLIY
ncbi:CLUMA_CG012872, isoform A [Clunio marinus]|uniref:CLUMA_CG012872, isoform A n=1 Tax=Clunio marinus TaxID=568069 RepID=A0A1J1IH57_9DIPT|nr:CLUMA_CG012872, isoform A [Clunio marinus]